MEQLLFKMKKFCSKTLKTLTDELNRPLHKNEMRNFSEKKLFVLQYTNIEKVESSHVLHDQVALLIRRHSERGTGNRQEKFLESFGPYIQKMLIKR